MKQLFMHEALGFRDAAARFAALHETEVVSIVGTETDEGGIAVKIIVRTENGELFNFFVLGTMAILSDNIFIALEKAYRRLSSGLTF